MTLESIGTATVNKGRVLDVYTTRGDGFTDGYIAQFRNLVDTKMYIRGDGNVGIGTTAPVALLSLGSSSSGYRQVLGGNNDAGQSFGLYTDTNGPNYNLANITGNYILKVGTAGGGTSYNSAALGGSVHMAFVAGSSVNVGIGTTGPSTKMEIRGTSPTLSVGTDADSQSASLLLRYQSSASNNGLQIHYDTGLAQSFIDTLYPATAGTVYGDLGIRTKDLSNVLQTRMYFEAKTGNVGIGTAAPTGKLTLEAASGDAFVLQRIGTTNKLIRMYESAADGYLEVRTGGDSIVSKLSGYTGTPTYFLSSVGIATTTPGYTLTVNGTAWCTSGAWTGSDLRWKENIKTLPDETLNKVLKLRGVSFDWKREEFKGNNFPEGKQIGLIAQEMEKEFPELVTTDKEGYKAIAYDRFTAVLLEAMKAQQKEIETLKQQIADRAGEDATLFEAINTIKAQTKEFQDLKAEIASLEDKVGGM